MRYPGVWSPTRPSVIFLGLVSGGFLGMLWTKDHIEQGDEQRTLNTTHTLPGLCWVLGHSS